MGLLIQQGLPHSISRHRSRVADGRRPRQKIRIRDILNMSSGLRIIAPQDPDYDEKGPYPDPLLPHGVDRLVQQCAATRPQQWEPATVGRYLGNTDPVLTNYTDCMAVGSAASTITRGRSVRCSTNSASRTFVLDTDPHGNFLTHGYESALTRAHRQPVSAGRRLERRTPAAGRLGQVREHRRARVGSRQPSAVRRLAVLGEWRQQLPAPKDTFMAGVGGQNVVIIRRTSLRSCALGITKDRQQPATRDLQRRLGCW